MMKISERQAMFRALPELQQIHAVATHEAGHTVIFVEFAVPLKKVFLKRIEEGVVGESQVSEQHDWFWSRSRERAISRLGGYAAERNVLGNELCVHDQDYERALYDLDRTIPNPEFCADLLYQGVLDLPYREALGIVAKRRHEVEAIASELERMFDSTYCELTGQEVQNLLQRLTGERM